MITSWTTGVEQVTAKFSQIPTSLRESLRLEVARLSFELVGRVQDDYLSGRALNVRTGRLRRSINAQQTDTSNEVSAVVGANMDKAKYAAAWEFGFNRKVGAGANGGPRTLFGKARERYFLKHPPGTKDFAARPFVHPAFKGMTVEIISGIKRVGLQSAKDTFK